MWELIAISNETDRVWRWRADRQQSVRLGRNPKGGWATPWDPRISTEHAELHFEDDQVRIVRLKSARNAIHFRHGAADECQLGPGDEFRIGSTTFRLYAIARDEPLRDADGLAEEMRRLLGRLESSTGPPPVETSLEVALELIDRDGNAAGAVATPPSPRDTIDHAGPQDSTTGSLRLFDGLEPSACQSTFAHTDEVAAGLGEVSEPCAERLAVDGLDHRAEEALPQEASIPDGVCRCDPQSELAELRQRFDTLQQAAPPGEFDEERPGAEVAHWRAEAERLREEIRQLEGKLAETSLAARPLPRPRPRLTVAAQFDPYYRWLAIPPEEQPPDYYRLLGLARFEEDAEIIEYAADRQMDLVRRQQSGKHARFSQQLLNELSRARICLRDPDKKQAYDAGLWRELESHRPPLVTATTSPANLSISLDGTAFRDYGLLDHVAETRHGHVFKAVHQTLGRTVALSILSEPASRNPQLLLRFQLKAQMLSRADHPALLRAHDAGQEEACYLVTEFVDGEHLVERLKHGPALSVPEAVGYIVPIAGALHYLHERGVIHRNVKPSNILRCRDGSVRLIGTGSALYLPGSTLVDGKRRELLEEPWPSGSLDYMAPEQAVDSRRIDRGVDIYSLGCTLFTLLARRLLYPLSEAAAKVEAHRLRPIPSLTALRSDVPYELERIVHKMLHKSRSSRYRDMPAVLDDLRRAGFAASP
ncbi:MAG: protein kinase [Pirellulaceae bacterium]